MKDRDRTTYARRLALAATDLDALLPSVLPRWREFRSEGFGAGTSGPQVRASGSSSPTESRALRADRIDQQSKQWDELLQRVARDVEHLVRVARDIVSGGPTRARCANPHCPDNGYATELARCKSCAQYRRRNGKDRS